MKIAYLFGAGASCQSLPIVNQIPSRILEVIQILKNIENEFSLNEKTVIQEKEYSYSEIKTELISDLKWVLKNSENHASIDTFAKKLYLKRKDDELNKLKRAFSVYFIIEQLINKADNRYDSFYASILKEDFYEFPENMRILSWNYDNQFEKSFSDYTENDEIITNRNFLKVVTKYSYDRTDNSKFCILKLNGSTNLMSDNGFREYQFLTKVNGNLNKENLKNLLKNYAFLARKESKVFSGLSFAWEKFHNERNNIIEKAKNETFDTEILVVIGYSFPFFNREIDREIINNMKDLKKVYFQAPDANNLKERFLSIRDNIEKSNLLERYDLEQFVLPNEL